MIVSIGSVFTETNNVFNKAEEAIAFIKNFHHVVNRVILQGPVGLAAGYFILNRAKNTEGYNPPEIIVHEENSPEEVEKLNKIIASIVHCMARRYSRR